MTTTSSSGTFKRLVLSWIGCRTSRAEAHRPSWTKRPGGPVAPRAREEIKPGRMPRTHAALTRTPQIEGRSNRDAPHVPPRDPGRGLTKSWKTRARVCSANPRAAHRPANQMPTPTSPARRCTALSGTGCTGPGSWDRPRAPRLEVLRRSPGVTARRQMSPPRQRRRAPAGRGRVGGGLGGALPGDVLVTRHLEAEVPGGGA